MFSVVLGIAGVAFWLISREAVNGTKVADWPRFLLPITAIAFPLLTQLTFGNTRLIQPFAMFPALPLFINLLVACVGPGMNRKLNTAAAPILMCCAFATVIGYWQGNGWVQPLIGAVLAVMVMATPSRSAGAADILKGSLVSARLTFVILWFFATFYSTETVAACRHDKCSILGAALQAGNSGNVIGLIVVLLIPWCVLALGFRRGIAASLLLLVPCELSAGRTAMIAGVLASSVSLLVVVKSRPRLASVGALGAASVAVGISVLPVLHGYRQTAYTTRGALWARAKELFPQKPLFGYGPGYWTRQEGSPEALTSYGVHNIWLQSLIGVGAVGVALLITSMVIVIIRARGHRLVAIALLTPIVGSGFTEVSLTPYQPSIAFAALPILLTIIHMWHLGPEALPDRREARVNIPPQRAVVPPRRPSFQFPRTGAACR